MNIQQLEEFMHQRIRLFLANGGRLEQCNFGDGEKCRCVITACDTDPFTDSIKAIDRWAKESGLGEMDAWSVIHGFDGYSPHDGEKEDLHDLGRRLAEEYLS